MSNQAFDIEYIVFHRVCRKPKLFSIVKSDFFSEKYVKLLYEYTESFYKQFQEIPFDITDPSVDQLEKVVYADPDKTYYINPDIDDKSQAIKTFINNCETILNFSYDNYSEKWLESHIDKAWIPWMSQEIGFKRAIEYRKTMSLNPENIGEVLNKSLNIIQDYSNIIIDDEESRDFLDPETHIQLKPENLIDTGFPKLNMWLSGDYNGGFEPGTLSIFIAAPNVGKSIWLANIALNMAKRGYNVLLVSLEMETHKIAKRLGSNAFNVNISEYGKLSDDVNYMGKKIKNFKESVSTGSMMDNMMLEEDAPSVPFGNLRLKKFPAATALDIHNFAEQEEKKLGITYHAIILDYMTELSNSYGTNPENMYQYHKQNVNDMFSSAGKINNKKAWITAHQIHAKWGDFLDYGLDSLSESSGIQHRPDNIIGIVQNRELKRINKYWLKYLKPRDGENKNWKLEYDIKYENMRISETGLQLDPTQEIEIIG